MQTDVDTELQELLQRFITEVHSQHGKYDFALGYLMSMFTREAKLNPKMAERAIAQFKVYFKKYEY